MKKSKHAPIVVALLAAAAVTVGCHSRGLVRFDSHPTRKVVLVETVERYNYVVAATAERVFWACFEEQDSLICEKRCGADTGYRCPTGFFFSNGVAPNLR